MRTVRRTPNCKSLVAEVYTWNLRTTTTSSLSERAQGARSQGYPNEGFVRGCAPALEFDA